MLAHWHGLLGRIKGAAIINVIRSTSFFSAWVSQNVCSEKKVCYGQLAGVASSVQWLNALMSSFGVADF